MDVTYLSAETVHDPLMYIPVETLSILTKQAQVEGYMWLVGLVALALLIIGLTLLCNAYEYSYKHDATAIVAMCLIVVFVFLLMAGAPRIATGITNPKMYIVKYMLKKGT